MSKIRFVLLGGTCGLVFNRFGKHDESSRGAADLADRLNRQRTKWLDAVSVECRGGEAILGGVPRSARDSLAPSAIASEFQAVHALSLAHANNYVSPNDMSRFTAALREQLSNGAMTDKWKDAVRHYTGLKSSQRDVATRDISLLGGSDPTAGRGAAVVR